MALKIGGIVNDSIVDGPGVRMTVFLQGCLHHCVGCHNKELLPQEGGRSMAVDEIIELALANPLLDGLTISGGEPFLQAREAALLAAQAKRSGLNIIVYTGYTFEELLQGILVAKHEGWEELLRASDILVDGLFELELKDPLLLFRGSSNQRILDVEKSLRQDAAVLVEMQ